MNRGRGEGGGLHLNVDFNFMVDELEHAFARKTLCQALKFSKVWNTLTMCTQQHNFLFNSHMNKMVLCNSM